MSEVGKRYGLPGSYDQALLPPSSPDGYGSLSNFARSVELDTWVGQLFSGGMSPSDEADPEYTIANDPNIAGDPNMFMHMVREGIQNQEQSDWFAQRYRRNTQLRRELDNNGASWSRFFSQFADPLNYIPFATVRGLGMARGAFRGAGENLFIGAAAEGFRKTLDPTMTTEEGVMNVGFGMVIGAGLGSISGSLGRRRRSVREERPGSVVPHGPPERYYRPAVSDEIDAIRFSTEGAGDRVSYSLRNNEAHSRTKFDRYFNNLAPDIRNELDDISDGVTKNPELSQRILLHADMQERNAARARVFAAARAANPESEVILSIEKEGGTFMMAVGKEGDEVAAELIEVVPDLTATARQMAGQDGTIDLSILTNDELGGTTPTLRADAPSRRADDSVAPNAGLEEMSPLDHRFGLVNAELQDWRIERGHQHHLELEARAEELDQAIEDLEVTLTHGQREDPDLVEVMSEELNEKMVMRDQLATEIESSSRYMRDEIETKERLHELHNYAGSELASFGGRMNHWLKMPFYAITNNKFAKHNPKLADTMRRTAQRLAAPFNIRTTGEMSGTKARDLSAEAAAWLWREPLINARKVAGQAYMELLGDAPTANNATRALGVESAVQGTANVVGAVTPTAVSSRLPALDGFINRRQGEMTFDDFNSYVFSEIASPGGEWSSELTAIAKEKIQKAARAYTEEFFQPIEKALRDHGMYPDIQQLTKKIEREQEQLVRADRKLEHYNNRLRLYEANEVPEIAERDYEQYLTNLAEHGKGPRGDALNFSRWVASRQSVYRELIEKQMQRVWEQKALVEGFEQELKAAKNAAAVRNVRAKNYVPFRLVMDNIEANEEGLRQVLREHFLAHPHEHTRPDGQIIPGTPEFVDERVEWVMHDMMRDAQTPDEIAARTGKRRDQLVQRHNEAALRLGEYHRIGEYAREIPFRIVEGDDADIIDEAVAFFRYENDGTATIHISRERIRHLWENDELYRKFDNFEDAYNFVLEHEKAHARIQRGRNVEFEGDHEARVNREALRVLKDGPPQGEELTQLKDDLRRAEHAIKSFDEGTLAFGSLPMLRQAQLDVPYEKLAPYLETNIERATEVYLRSVAPSIEITRQFGDMRMERFLADMRMEMDETLANIPDPKERADMEVHANEMMQSMRDLRDVVLGIHGVKVDPTAFDKGVMRITQSLKDLSILTLMGRPLLAAFADLGLVVFTEGAAPVVRGLVRMVVQAPDERSAYRLGVEEARQIGLIDEMASNMRAQLMFNLHDYMGATTKLEKTLHNNAGRQFIVNGLSYWTDTMKGFTTHLAIDRLLRDSGKLLDGTLGEEATRNLYHAGIDKAFARRLRHQWNAAGAQMHGETFVANTHMWTDPEVSRRFKTILVQTVNEAVLTPGAGTRPTFFTDPVMSMILQYRSFSVAFTQALTMAALQRTVGAGRADAATFNAVIATVMMGYVIDQLKTPDWAEMEMDERIFRAVEQSGVMGVLGDMNSMLETATGGSFGARSLMGQDMIVREPTPGDAAGAFLGPAIGQWSNLIYAMFSDEATGDQQARALRYMIPYNNLLWWNGMFSDAQRGLGDFLED